MGETACSADTSTNTCHTLDEVGVENTLALLKQSGLACLDTVADHRLNLKVNILLAHSLCSRLSKTAYAGKYSAKEGCARKLSVIKSLDVDVTAVVECLKLLEGKHSVNVRLRLLKLRLCLLCNAGTDEDNLCIRVLLLHEPCQRHHGGRIVGDIFVKLWERLVNILYKRGTTGRGKEALLRKLLSFLKSNHICANRRRKHVVEAKLIKSRYNLSQPCVRELAGNRGSDYGINLRAALLCARLKKLDRADDE